MPSSARVRSADRFRCARRRRRPWSARRPAAPRARRRFRGRTAPSAGCRRRDWRPSSRSRARGRAAARGPRRSMRGLAGAIDEPEARQPVEDPHADILAHREVEEQALGVAVVGDEADAGGADRAGRRPVEPRAAHPTTPALRGVDAGERAQELALALALDPGEADDLARARGQTHVVEAGAAEPGHFEQQRRRDPRLSRERSGASGRPGDQRHDLADRNLAGAPALDDLAVAHDRDAVGERGHLVQPVRDIDDRRRPGRAGGGSDRRAGRCRPAGTVRSARRGISIDGSVASARAISTMWRCASESSPTPGARSIRNCRRWRPARSVCCARRRRSVPARSGRGELEILEHRKIGGRGRDADRRPKRPCSRTRARPLRRPTARRRSGVAGIGGEQPAAIPIRVDLPAPFSPTMAWTSPG